MVCDSRGTVPKIRVSRWQPIQNRYNTDNKETQTHETPPDRNHRSHGMAVP